MKKSVCLMAVLGALGASSAFAAQHVTVEFAGEVRAKACNVTLVDGSNKIELGHLLTSAQANTTGQAHPVVFKLTGCGLGNKATAPVIALHQNLTITPEAIGNTSISDGTLGTNNGKVVVQFGTEDKQDGLQPQKVIVNDTNGENYVIQYGYAYLKAKDGTPTAGKVNAKALFTVTYN